MMNGGLSNGLRSSGKTEENACRQMGNPNFWSISGLGQMVKSFSHLSNVYIRFYEVIAVYGRMGTSFYHLSELFAESGQTENLYLIYWIYLFKCLVSSKKLDK